MRGDIVYIYSVLYTYSTEENKEKLQQNVEQTIIRGYIAYIYSVLYTYSRDKKKEKITTKRRTNPYWSFGQLFPFLVPFDIKHGAL